MREGEEIISELTAKLRRANAELSACRERYRHLVEGTQGMICTHDLNGVLLSVNPAANTILGYERDEMVGHNLADFLPPERAPFFGHFLAKMKAERADSGRLLLVAKDGRLVTLQYHNVLIDGEDGEYVLGHAYDISEVIDLHRQLEELAVTDDLTALNNRRGFMARANDRIAHAARAGETLAIIFADVDGLKAINDAHGHATGSQIIVDTANILSDCCRHTDVLSRWGGDEFVVLLAATKHGLEIVVDRIQGKIDDFNKTSDRPYKVSVSLGVEIFEASGDVDINALISHADHSMYREKRLKK